MIEAWALIDPNWGEPFIVLDTIRETEAAAREAATTTKSRGVMLYSGASDSCVPPIKGSMGQLEYYGFRVARIGLSILSEDAADMRREDA